MDGRSFFLLDLVTFALPRTGDFVCCLVFAFVVRVLAGVRRLDLAIDVNPAVSAISLVFSVLPGPGFRPRFAPFRVPFVATLDISSTRDPLTVGRPRPRLPGLELLAVVLRLCSPIFGFASSTLSAPDLRVFSLVFGGGVVAFLTLSSSLTVGDFRGRPGFRFVPGGESSYGSDATVDAESGSLW